MEYSEVKSYLYGLINYGASYGIDRMRLLAKLLGNPEKEIPLIHVAGTNGKGSVCAMVEAIYRKNQYRTGLFTSPHLVRLEERIQVDRKSIPENQFVQYIETIKQIVDNSVYEKDELRPSFFEILNATGFLYFAEKKVDVGIIETGLGGRFDSTNIITPLVSVITSISRDHTEILGESLESIALAKAGIIKPGVPVVIGLMPTEAEAVIRNVAHELNSPVFSVKENYGENLNNYPTTSLQGSYQRSNAATALLTAQIIKDKFPIDDEIALEALKEVNWPGRWQTLFFDTHKVILDCAHNEAGAQGLAENLEDLIHKEGKKPVMIVGTIGQSRASVIIPIIAQYAEAIILVQINNPKATDINTLRTFIPNTFKGDVIEGSIKELFPEASTCNLQIEGSTLVATGSIYLIGEILEQIERLN